MKIERFEDIEAWKEARELVKHVYRVLSQVKDYSFRDQIQRAALSIMSNIAEGFDRSSNKEFVQFLIISRGSVSEVRSLCYAALDLGYIGQDEADSIMKRCFKLTNLLNGFIRYLRSSPRKF